MQKQTAIPRYQLMKLDEFGRTFPIGTAGNPLPLFEEKIDAISYAKENHELFPFCRFEVKEVYELEVVDQLLDRGEEQLELPNEGQEHNGRPARDMKKAFEEQ